MPYFKQFPKVEYDFERNGIVQNMVDIFRHVKPLQNFVDNFSGYRFYNIINGEMFISIDRISENAHEFGVSFIDELHRVMVHGVLHLCGFKDKTPEDQKVMSMKEDFYLNLRNF